MVEQKYEFTCEQCQTIIGASSKLKVIEALVIHVNKCISRRV